MKKYQHHIDVQREVLPTTHGTTIAVLKGARSKKTDNWLSRLINAQ